MSVDTMSLGRPSTGPVGLDGIGKIIGSLGAKLLEVCKIPDFIVSRDTHYVARDTNIMLYLQMIDPKIVDRLDTNDAGKFLGVNGLDYYFSKFVLLKGEGDKFYLASLNSLQHKISPHGNVNNHGQIGRNHEDVALFARRYFKDALLEPYAGGNVYFMCDRTTGIGVLHFWGESGAYHKLDSSGAHSIIRDIMTKLGIKVSFESPFNTIKN